MILRANRQSVCADEQNGGRDRPRQLLKRPLCFSGVNLLFLTLTAAQDVAQITLKVVGTNPLGAHPHCLGISSPFFYKVFGFKRLGESNSTSRPNSHQSHSFWLHRPFAFRHSCEH